MIISRVEVERYFGFTGANSFSPTVNFLVGINGGGKTTCLNIINAITGVDAIDPRDFITTNFGKIRVEVQQDDGDEEVFELFGGIDVEAIEEFRKKLTQRTRWVCVPPYMATGAYGDETDFEEHPRKFEIVSSMFDDPFRHKVNTDGSVIQYRGGAGQEWINQYLSRWAPSGCPQLYDIPERSLDLNSQRLFSDTVLPDDTQSIVVTHSPCIITKHDAAMNIWNP